MKISFYITDRSNKDAIAPIRMRLRDGRQVDLYGLTEEEIPVKYWDKKSGWVGNDSKFTRRRTLISDLRELKDFVEDEYLTAKKAGGISKGWLRESIQRHYHGEKEPESLFEFIRWYIDEAPRRKDGRDNKPVSYKQVREYERTFFYLKEFCEMEGREYDFSDIDLDFYNDWVEFMEGRGLAQNTIGKKIQTLKIFLNHAALSPEKFKVNPKYRSKQFKTLKEESDGIYLDTDELDMLYKLDLSKTPSQDRVRDHFLIGAWTGCRFSDLDQVKKENIKDGKIHVVQKKTGAKVPIPIHPVVKSILEKYDYEIPSMIQNQPFNRILKKIAQKAKINSPIHIRITKGGKTINTKYEKWELVTSHTARRSFATNLYKSRFPAISIMKITGHSTETAFLKYIKVTPEEHADLLQAHWEKQSI